MAIFHFPIPKSLPSRGKKEEGRFVVINLISVNIVQQLYQNEYMLPCIPKVSHLYPVKMKRLLRLKIHDNHKIK